MHIHRDLGRRSNRRHRDDSIGPRTVRRTGKHQHLVHRYARATEHHRKSTVHLAKDVIQCTDPLFLPQEVELSDHHRPDDPVLP